jgi:hypothetical protein
MPRIHPETRLRKQLNSLWQDRGGMRWFLILALVFVANSLHSIVDVPTTASTISVLTFDFMIHSTADTTCTGRRAAPYGSFAASPSQQQRVSSGRRSG